MSRTLRYLIAIASGCGGAQEAATIASVEVPLEVPDAPSAVAELGIGEEIVSTPPDLAAERALRGASKAIADCLRESLDRDRDLRGTLGFSLALGPDGQAYGPPAVSGSLATLPSARCASTELRRLSGAATGSAARIEYKLTFRGGSGAAPLAAGTVEPRETLLLVDWNARDGVASGFSPAPWSDGRSATARCLLGGSGPSSDVWLVAVVNRSGTVSLDPATPDVDEATHCVRRKLSAMQFAAGTRDVALSVLLRRPAAPGDAQSEPDARGNMWGDEIGDAFGAGGLGLTGVGGGGEGTFGMGSIGTIGHGAGTGTGQGFGSSGGKMGGRASAKPPSVRMGATSVSGRLPPEVIQRIVRQNFGRFRLCYENGLRTSPNLAGRVTVQFTIGREGDVSSTSAKDDGVGKEVASCVGKAFMGLKFPQPEGGIVKVSYPIVFSPGEDAPAAHGRLGPAEGGPGAAKPATVAGVPIKDLTVAGLERSLVARGVLVQTVPAGSAGERAPMLFVRTGAELRSVRLVDGKTTASGCAASDGKKSLVVSGDNCRALLDTIVDR